MSFQKLSQTCECAFKFSFFKNCKTNVFIFISILIPIINNFIKTPIKIKMNSALRIWVYNFATSCSFRETKTMIVNSCYIFCISQKRFYITIFFISWTWIPSLKICVYFGVFKSISGFHATKFCSIKITGFRYSCFTVRVAMHNLISVSCNRKTVHYPFFII